MADDIAIKVDNVSKVFRLPHDKNTSIKGAAINFYKRKKSYEKQRALKDISFEVKQGEFFGIVGRNGSGKSTLLKMLAGIYAPSKGAIHVNGKLTPFIELGVGFNMELTGRENVFLNGALLGFNRKEMNRMYKGIVEFAELERFMDQKLKNYSSGMQVRLAFSIAIRAQSDILLLDEVLAVGDAIFQQKCFDYFKELKKDKKTVVFVSHDSGALQQYCDRGILLENGNLILSGSIEEVINSYKDILVEKERAIAEKGSTNREEKRWGSKYIEVVSATPLNSKAQRQTVFTDDDAEISIKVKYRANRNCPEPIYGLTINDSSGQQLFASNTRWSKVKVPELSRGKTMELVWKVPNAFNTGSYAVNPAVSNDSGAVMYDWRDSLAEFKIRKKLESTAEINVAHDIIIESD